MADDFDRFLSEALAPPARDPDRAFVRRVQARVALEERLRSEQADQLRRLALQLVALAAVAVGLLWLTKAPDIAAFASDSPATALAAFLAGFTFLVALLAFAASPVRTSELRL